MVYAMFSIGILGFLVWSQEIVINVSAIENFMFISIMVFLTPWALKYIRSNLIDILRFLGHPIILFFLFFLFFFYVQYKWGLSPVYCVDEAITKAPDAAAAGKVPTAGKAIGDFMEWYVDKGYLKVTLWAAGSATFAWHVFNQTAGASIRWHIGYGASAFFAGGTAKALTEWVYGPKQEVDHSLPDVMINDIRESCVVRSIHLHPLINNDNTINTILNSDPRDIIPKHYLAHSVVEGPSDGLSIWSYLTSIFTSTPLFFESYYNTLNLLVYVLVFAMIIIATFMSIQHALGYFNSENVYKWGENLVWVRDILLLTCYFLAVILSCYLFFFYNIDNNTIIICNDIMKDFHGLTTGDYYISHRYFDTPIEYFEKVIVGIGIITLGFYRSYVLIKPKAWGNTQKFIFISISGMITRKIVSYVTSEEVVKQKVMAGKTLFELFARYNEITLVIFFFLIMIGVCFIIAHFTEKWLEKQEFSTKFTRIMDVFIVFMKIIVGACFLCVSVGAINIYMFELPSKYHNIIDEAIKFSINNETTIYKMALFNCEVEVINFAICWNSSISWDTLIRSKKAHRWTKSARNFTLSVRKNTDNKSSSETTRKTCFQFDSFHKIHSKFYPNLPIIDNKWLEWFIGFSEGDGSLLTSIKAKDKRLRFVLTQKEKQVLDHIQNIFGFGSVRHIPNGDYYRYIVEDNKNIFILAIVFNSNLVIPYRITQLQKWIVALNDSINNPTSYLQLRYKVTQTIQFIHNPRVFTLNDAWLSGFVDAEGNFTVEVTKRPKNVLGYQCNMRFILDQNNSQETLQYIVSLFGTGNVYHRKDTIAVYRITLRSIKSIKIVYHYFTHFHLKTMKRFSFQKWSVIYNILLRKEHVTIIGLSKIKSLGKLINTNNARNKPIGKAKV